MSRRPFVTALLAGAALMVGCADPVQPRAEVEVEAQYAANANACWGQATKVFAQTGVMGEHASQQANPRVGLANLARELYAQGVIPAPTMQALGKFVADALGLTIDACT